MRSKKASGLDFQAIYKEMVNFKSVPEAKHFFDLLLTEREINDMVRRFQVLKMLERGKTYQEIQEVLKMSPATISRLSIGFGYGESELNRKMINTNP